MAIYDLYFKRKRKELGQMPDVYQYDKLPTALKIQIVHIWHATFGGPTEAEDGAPYRAYQNMSEIVAKELGEFRLGGATVHGGPYTEWVGTFLNRDDLDLELSMIELAAVGIENVTARYDYRNIAGAQKIAKDAIEEINERFREHRVGYQLSERRIIRVDSQFLHAEAVRPALSLLGAKEFAGAQAEFLKAHEAYRHGDSKHALAEALKALESTMKSICLKRKWGVDSNATSKALIAVLFEKGLIPAYWQSHFGGLRTTLESGVPTARNKDGGHGQGATVTTVPQHLAAYVLHQTAAAIVFLIEAERA